jgi:iron complex outermembrane receptor protein
VISDARHPKVTRVCPVLQLEYAEVAKTQMFRPLVIAGPLLAALPLAAALAATPAVDTTLPSKTAPVENASELEMIVVTATRTPMKLGDVPSAIQVVDRDEIERSSSKTLDELLRNSPSFGLFRRSSSVAADPSSQGVRLRNVGASGVSRALVLVDGIPANDPFGGWVAWRAIPRIGLDRIEVAPGGGSELYGNFALGGVIQAFSRPIDGNELDLNTEYGSFDTTMIAVRAAGSRSGLGGALEGEYFDSNGYPVVAKDARGSIDGDTPSHHATINGRLTFEPTSELRVDLAAGWFDESLNGGTRYTTAAMRRAEYSARATSSPADAGTFGVTLFGHDGEFQQDRARVGAGRNSESLSAHQDVPSRDLGVSLLWNSPALRLAGLHAFTVGTDFHWVQGTTLEDLFPPAASLPSNPTVRRDAGGRQRLVGVFAEDTYRLSDTVGAVLAVRYDQWENSDGWRNETAHDGTLTSSRFTDRWGGEVSPKLGLHWRIADLYSVRASAYRSFRAPTLDELYRPFQAGTIRTDSNPDLDPERLTGGELGLDIGGTSGPVLRLSAFRNDLRDPIVNVSTGPNTRQRQNLGMARIQGFELDGRWNFAPHWSADISTTLADTEVTEAPGQPQLVGKELPQAPRLQGHFGLSFDDPSRWTASLSVRYVGEQYENDINTLPMGDVWLTDLFASWHANPQLELFLAVENLFDQTYLVGRSGVDTTGQPRFVHGGVRVTLGKSE